LYVYFYIPQPNEDEIQSPYTILNPSNLNEYF
jgi:hypothetical protein